LEIVLQKPILIIDDNDDDVLLTKTIISQINPDVTTEVAMSGDEGLSILRSGKCLPLLILLDLKMPKMDGIQVLQNIRSDNHLRHIPVVILTNSELESDRQASVKAGANTFLQKALSIDKFKNDMEEVLKCWLEANGVH
jgi:CheY-like chemotaxis protein